MVFDSWKPAQKQTSTLKKHSAS